MKIEKGKKIKLINIIFLYFIYIIIGICLLYNIIFTINTTISQNDYFKIFGINFFAVEDDLMKDDLNKNDLVIVKQVSENELQEGDIIAYTINGKTRINKIINKKSEYTTKSNKNYYPDVETIGYSQVIGKKIVNIPSLGIVITILQSKITTAVILLILIIYFLYDRHIFIKKIERVKKKKRYEKEKKGTGSICA